MKTFTTYAAKAKQILNLLQGYTKGIRMTAILILLLMGVSNAWGETLYVPGYNGNWSNTNENKMTGSNSPWTFTAYWDYAMEFKIHNGSQWIGKTTSAVTVGGNSAALQTGGGNNMKFNHNQGGIYTITVTKSGTTYYIEVDAVVEEGTTEYDISDNTHIYFNVAAAANEYQSASILLGKSDGSEDFPMEGKIGNTELFYKNGEMGQL